MRELIHNREVFDENFDFKCTAVVYREHGHYYHSTVSNRLFGPRATPVDPNIITNGTRIPLETICLPLPSHLVSTALVAPLVVPPDTHVKSIESMLGGLSGGGSRLGKALIAELEVYELIRRSVYPYPRALCEYRGCIINAQSCVTGLCFKKYPHSLLDIIVGSLPFDKSAVMDGCQRAVALLHGLGLVHVRRMSFPAA